VDVEGIEGYMQLVGRIVLDSHYELVELGMLVELGILLELGILIELGMPVELGMLAVLYLA
jgi:hypothetical protein